MTAAVLVLEPIFEADLQPEQYAYRPQRSALDAVRHVHRLLKSRHWEVIDADLSGYFDTIPHAELMKSVSRRISDRHMLHLIKMWCIGPVILYGPFGWDKSPVSQRRMREWRELAQKTAECRGEQHG